MLPVSSYSVKSLIHKNLPRLLTGVKRKAKHMKYRKKPVVIEAIQWNGINLEEIKQFAGDSLEYHICDTAWEVGKGKPHVSIKIKTLEGVMSASEGDYIIRGVNGEIYPCKPDIFEKTYEAVEEVGCL